MHALTLDFQDSRNHASLASFLLLISALAITVFLTYLCITQFDNIGTLQAQLVSLEQHTHGRTQTAPLSAAQAQRQHAEIKEANTVVTQLALPWSALFNDIGNAQQKKIALLSIIPDASKQSIKLTGEAKNLTAVLTYIRQLQKSKSLRAVYLQSHQIELRSAEKPVYFSILATWVQAP